MVTESWFRSIWKSSKKHESGDGKAVIGVLAFELARLMSKLINLWHSLGDKQVSNLREEITNAVGIKKLVSEDEDHIVKLMSMELMENMSHVARSVARLSRKCDDPLLKSFEQAFDDICRIGVDPYGWLFTMKIMEKKVKKMERLIVCTANLYQEMEALGDLEQNLRRMKSSDDVESSSLVEYEKRIAWKQQEVKHLKQNSIWNRTYDHMVLLLASSLFTIFCRTGHVFGINHMVDMGASDSRVLESNYTNRGRSLAYTQSSVHPSENRITRFSSGPLGRATTKSGPIIGRNNKSSLSSVPVGSSLATSSPISEKHEILNFSSGPLVKSVTKSGMLARASKGGFRLWQSRNQLSFLQVKSAFSKRSKLKASGPFNVCLAGGNGTSSRSNFNMNMDLGGNNAEVVDFCILGKGIHGNQLMNAPVETLGGAALALHYANIIIVIEKLVATPHLISQDARDDLYNMLPASIRGALTAKLKPYAKALISSVCDTNLAAEWNESMSGILEWLAPLAHNMIRWQSERSFEHQCSASRTNVMLVQTLHFANQEKTEASVTELLLGLSYVSRYGKELNASNMTECTSGRTFDDYMEG